MFTSCGWFFAELSGIETVQVMKAARAIQLARDAAGVDLEPAFVEALARAPSNVPELGDGRRVYETLVRPSVASLEGGAHLAIASSVRDMPTEGRLFCFRYRLEAGAVRSPVPRRSPSGGCTSSVITQEALDALFCVVHFGAADFRCGSVPYPGAAAHAEIERVLLAKLDQILPARLLREVDCAFPGRDYALRDLFLDERRRVAGVLLEGTLRRYEDDYLRASRTTGASWSSCRRSTRPSRRRCGSPRTSRSRAASSTSPDARSGEVRLADAEVELLAVVELARRLGARFDVVAVRREVEALVRARIDALSAGHAGSSRAAEVVGILDIARPVGLWLDLWEAQNRFWEWVGSRGMTLDREDRRPRAAALVRRAHGPGARRLRGPPGRGAARAGPDAPRGSRDGHPVPGAETPPPVIARHTSASLVAPRRRRRLALRV